jgi:hypothetical protein
MTRTVLLLAVAAWSVGGARAADSQPTPADLEFFEKKVRPLFVQRCYKCHASTSKKKQGGLLLDSRAGILRGGASGAVIVARQPDRSRLIQVVRYQDEHLQMPPSGKLPAREIAVLEEWVKRGAPAPGPSDVKETSSGIDLAKGRAFWSFQAPKQTSPPATRNKEWSRRRIDRFILAELEKHSLEPSPPASRRTLIRRVTFDLIGLPPTPAEVEAFVNITRPDAYARLIDRLLASPRHGERWGRFWLDLARYADIAEPWTESKGQAWLYRDWVVQAVNDDLPYDQFVQRQLAADLLPDARMSDQAALGFLGLSPVYWKELKLDKDVIKTVVAEEWEERIDAVARTFLGLTVACARCHDHKFDPISQRDYYALAGVFASIRQVDRPIRPIDFPSALSGFRLPAVSRMSAIDAALILHQSKIENRKSCSLPPSRKPACM